MSPWTALVLLAVLLAVVVTFAMLVRRQRRQLRDVSDVASKQWNDVMELRRSVNSLVQDQAAAAASRTQLEAELAALTKQQEQLMLLNADAASYMQAIRHAQRGADAGELVKTHGLAQAEAELIIALHQRTRSGD